MQVIVLPLDHSTMERIDKRHAAAHRQVLQKHIRQQLRTPDPPSYNAFGSTLENALHARLRMNMSHLNYHLIIIQKVESPECRCGYHKEDTIHFVLHCSEYQTRRDILLNSLSSALNVNFKNMPAKNQIDMLLHGTGLGGGDGAAVARHFQSFLLTSMRFSHLKKMCRL